MSQSIAARRRSRGTDREVTVRTPSGEAAGERELPGDIFDVQANIPLMHQVVVAQLAAARQGTHKTKTRAEVAGGGRKPYKQKGTGRARQGSIRAPQFTGGGVVHGPQPRDYSQRTPKKMKAAALRGALSDRARDGRVHVVAAFVDGETPSTKAAITVLDAVTAAKRVLVVLDRGRRPQLGEPAQRAAGAPDRGRPAQHLRRALRRRGGLHRDRPRRVPRRPGHRRPRRGQLRELPDLSTTEVEDVVPRSRCADHRRHRRGEGMSVRDPRDIICPR